MKKLFYVAIALMISSVSLFAQDKKEVNPKNQVIRKIAQVEMAVGDLTEKERAELKTLFTKCQAECAANAENVKEARKEKRAEVNAEMKRILGDEKYVKYTEVCKEKREARLEKKGGKGRKGEGRRGEARPMRPMPAM